MSDDRFGEMLPSIRHVPPGPESRRLATLLARYESPNVTYLAPGFPVFWEEAKGANVRDVDGNVYVDFTGAFAVAAAGHGHPAIVEAIAAQAHRLIHGMGDVHPPAIKVELLRKLAEVTPAGLNRAILANSGGEAVEAALKTSMLATGKPRFLAFRGSYHGLTLGALSVSGRDDFRAPFAGQLGPGAVFAGYPLVRRGAEAAGEVDRSIREIEGLLDGADGPSIGAILVEPVQGRGGDIVPPEGWLTRLRQLCDRRGLLLILDEIYTGFGRTGRWFACEHWGVTPDLMVVGKALTGGMPFAACVGTDAVMQAWPRSTGEALHTSTFLGHPLGCAAALASIDVLQKYGLVEQSAASGAYMLGRLRERLDQLPHVADVRGLGMMVGVELVRSRETNAPAPDLVGQVVVGALRRGLLLLGGGVSSNVLSLSPPLNIARDQLDHGIDILVDLVQHVS